ncbi:Hypothetical predicted protein [Cloeon dipterum]|uniref:Exosome complex component CSL4 C-terminal domain-containing protein n=1 Tax=Cloeon dipterum TaxID=197152 RepID=A0A8S1CYZ8_9INSE|nr:Hypothetical predicted protein [Cloeon dipterum]
MSSTNERIICVPGQVLCASSNDHVAGQGTFERMGYIYASLAGVVKVEKKLEINIVQVQSLKEQSTVPSPGDIVTARVLIVKSRQCMCEIKCIGDIALTRPFRAVLRQEDVRATEKDRVKMYESFAPGDIILARVVSFRKKILFLLRELFQKGLGGAVNFFQTLPKNYSYQIYPFS